MKKLLTLKEAASTLGVCPNTVRKMALPVVKLYANGRKMYCLEDLEAIIANRPKISEVVQDLCNSFVRTPRLHSNRGHKRS